MFLKGLDQPDQKILKLLIENARLSYSEIGERVGLSRVAVKARVDAMEKKGIIEEYTAIVNPQKISGAISCYLEIEAEPIWIQRVIDALSESETVTQIYRMTGEGLLHVHAVAPSQEDFQRFLREEIDPLEGVVRTRVHVILSRVKDVKGLRL